VAQVLRKVLHRIHELGKQVYMPAKPNETIMFMTDDHSDVHDLLNKIPLEIVNVQEVHERLGFREPLIYPETSLNKPLNLWKMENDDSPIFRYIYRSFRPQRHLEFGTWYGAGTVYCLDECDATVWTINLPFGEHQPDGLYAYAHDVANQDEIVDWAEKIGMKGNKGWYRTDTIGFIGRYYLERGLGNRVCQIYCDSQNWDISNYPKGFFDTVLIDGGHTEETILNDTAKAFSLLKPGGLIMWHDFCPDRDVIEKMEMPRCVTAAVLRAWSSFLPHLSDIFWIKPSWILLGVKR
jgi:hypothetical protein